MQRRKSETALVRPELVVEASVLARDVFEVAQAEAEEVVQALAFQFADPALPRRPMRRAEVAAAVLKAGYKSRSKTLAKSVGVALRTMPGVKKIGRGVFRAK